MYKELDRIGIFVLEVPADKKQFYFDGRVLSGKKPVPYRGKVITCRFADWRQKKTARRILFAQGPFIALVERNDNTVVQLLDPKKRQDWPDEFKCIKFSWN